VLAPQPLTPSSPCDPCKVLNTDEAMANFRNPRSVTVSTELQLTAGPVSRGASAAVSLAAESFTAPVTIAPCFLYAESKGYLYQQ